MASPSERNLNRLREALGRDYVDPLGSGRESRTRSELLRGEGPPSDVTAPEDQDMWGDLPPPEYVNGLRFIRQSSKSDRAVKRPDLYSEFYGDAPAGSTRVAGMQWIPTHVSDGGETFGDLVVAFARPSKTSGNQFYVYTQLTNDQWLEVQSSDSYGRAINRLTSSHAYHALSDSDSSRYKTLHEKSNGGEPWENWIFEIGDFGRSGDLNYSITWDPGLASIREKGAAARRKAKELSKKTRAQARKDRKSGDRMGTRNLSLDYTPNDQEDY
jgi:hypothetical protein